MKMVPVDYALLRAARHNLARYRAETSIINGRPYAPDQFYSVQSLTSFFSMAFSIKRIDDKSWSVAEELLPKIQMLAGPHWYTYLKALEAVHGKND
jgi:hypothetical protein